MCIFSITPVHGGSCSTCEFLVLVQITSSLLDWLGLLLLQCVCLYQFHLMDCRIGVLMRAFIMESNIGLLEGYCIRIERCDCLTLGECSSVWSVMAIVSSQCVEISGYYRETLINLFDALRHTKYLSIWWQVVYVGLDACETVFPLGSFDLMLLKCGGAECG